MELVKCEYVIMIVCCVCVCGFVRDFLEQLSSTNETVDEAALDEELRQVSLSQDRCIDRSIS